MNYFKIANDEAQQKAQELIERVKAEILDTLADRVVAIVLIGGLARGEGAWKKVEGQLKITSDLDLLVSTRFGTKVPRELQDRLKYIGEQTGIEVAPRFVDNSGLRFSPNITELFDIREVGIPLWGEIEKLGLPGIRRDAIGFNDIIYLFFNRIYVSINECSPDDFLSSDSEALERLSRSAAQTMFTCADFISINGHNYCSSVFDRVRYVEDNVSQQTIIDNKKLLADLHKALDFKFNRTDKLYLEDARDFWLKARNHLLDRFTFLLGQKYGIDDITKYAYFQRKELPYIAKARALVSRLRKVLRIVKIRKIPSLRSLPDPHYHCRLAWLMLYQALGERLQAENLDRAEDYLNQVYYRRQKGMDAREKWFALRDEVKRLRELGVA